MNSYTNEQSFPSALEVILGPRLKLEPSRENRMRRSIDSAVTPFDMWGNCEKVDRVMEYDVN